VSVRLFTVREAADRLGRSPHFVRARITAGDLRAVRWGSGPFYVPEDALDELAGVGNLPTPARRLVRMPEEV